MKILCTGCEKHTYNKQDEDKRAGFHNSLRFNWLINFDLTQDNTLFCNEVSEYVNELENLHSSLEWQSHHEVI